MNKQYHESMQKIKTDAAMRARIIENISKREEKSMEEKKQYHVSLEKKKRRIMPAVAAGLAVVVTAGVLVYLPFRNGKGEGNLPGAQTAEPTQQVTLQPTQSVTPQSTTVPVNGETPDPSAELKKTQINKVELTNSIAPVVANLENSGELGAYLAQFAAQINVMLQKGSIQSGTEVTDTMVKNLQKERTTVEVTFTKGIKLTTAEGSIQADGMTIDYLEGLCYICSNGQYQGSPITIPTEQKKYFAQMVCLNGAITANDALWVADKSFQVTEESYTAKEVTDAAKIVADKHAETAGRTPKVKVDLAEYSPYIYGYSLDNILGLYYGGDGKAEQYAILTREKKGDVWTLQEYGKASEKGFLN